MANCIVCGKELNNIDIGAHKKFINRASTEFMCKSCIAKDFKVPESAIDEKIECFKKMGCILFN
ncbi:MAG: hypothetical protein UHN02_04190 [Acutalibacteraceae bacterium]|nr:hypothetical protein [Acutalibacteraceae bacterium]